MSYIQVMVTVNGGSVDAATRPVSSRAGYGDVIGDSRKSSRNDDVSFIPTEEELTPLDIVEKRAVACLLASLRTQRDPLR